jgi:hypothetical protein
MKTLYIETVEPEERAKMQRFEFSCVTPGKVAFTSSSLGFSLKHAERRLRKLVDKGVAIVPAVGVEAA